MIFMKSGVRQGCPLSPFLFNLSLTPLILCINGNLNKLFLKSSNIPINRAICYADEFTFMYKNKKDINSLLKILEDFSYLSVLKMNYKKTVAFNDFHSKWNQKTYHTFLGIPILPNGSIQWKTVTENLEHSFRYYKSK